MPNTYELFVIIRRLSRNDTIACLKRTSELILDNNGVLRKIENLGTRNLPHKMSTPVKGNPRYTTGNYFLYHFDYPPSKLPQMKDTLKLDLDFIRINLIKKQIYLQPNYACTLEEELQPPAFRKTVQLLIEESRIKREREMPHNDLDLTHHEFC